MKFESKLGIGEIVVWLRRHPTTGEIVHDEMVEVTAIAFAQDKNLDGVCTIVTCRFPDGRLVSLYENELQGDSEFDQETGAYPNELLVS